MIEGNGIRDFVLVRPFSLLLSLHRRLYFTSAKSCDILKKVYEISLDLAGQLDLLPCYHNTHVVLEKTKRILWLKFKLDSEATEIGAWACITAEGNFVDFVSSASQRQYSTQYRARCRNLEGQLHRIRRKWIPKKLRALCESQVRNPCNLARSERNTSSSTISCL